MKDTGVPADAEEVRGVIRKCLHQAALVNYARVSEYASIESMNARCLSPSYCPKEYHSIETVNN